MTKPIIDNIMKRVFFLTGVAALLLAASCAKEPVDVIDAPGISPELYASIETQDETKVYVDDNLRVLWNADDRVSVFYRYSYNKQYKFKGQTGANAGSFSEIPNTDLVTGNELDHIYAVYPYREETAVTNDGIIQVELPAVQTYALNSFGLGMNTMVSVSDDNNLLFRNAVGYLMLKIYGDACIKTITLSGKRGQKIAGAASITMAPGEFPEIAMAGNATTSVTLDCGNGVTVGPDANNYTEFWFALPPTDFVSGFSVVVTDVYGHTFTKDAKYIYIQRNQLQKMAPIEVNMPHTDSDNITFEDPSVKEWLVRSFDTNHDGEISFAEAAAVTSSQMVSFFDVPLDAVYPQAPATPFRTFKEFRYFTGLTEVPAGCFHNCSSLESILFPPTVTAIATDAFFGCTALKKVDLPANVTEVSYLAFDNSGVEEFTMRATAPVTIDNEAFGSRHLETPLRKVTLYSVVPPAIWNPSHYGIGSRLAGAWGGVEYYVPAGSWSDYIMAWFDLYDTIHPIPETMDGIISFEDPTTRRLLVNYGNIDANGDGAISYAEAYAVTEEDIAQCFGYQGLRTFNELKYFMGLESIPAGMFFNCYDLTEVSLPASVTRIENNAFEGCSSMTDFTAGFYVASIGYQAFLNCTSLERVTLYGLGLDFVGQPFNNCNSLKTLKIFADFIPEIVTAHSNFMLPSTCSILVKPSAVNNYKTSSWSLFADQISALDRDEWSAYSSFYLPQ